MPSPVAIRRCSALPVATPLLVLLFVAGCDSEPPAPEKANAPAAASTKNAPAPPTADGPADDATARTVSETDNPFAAGDEAAKNQPPSDRPPGQDPLVPAEAKRTSTQGWWRIVFSVDGQDYSAGFLKIGNEEGGKPIVQELRTNGIINPAKAVRHEVTAESVRIFFEHDENKFDFAGSLADNVIRGNIQFASPRQILVRLVPIEESAATDAALDKTELGPTFGTEQIVAALQSDSPVPKLRETAKTWKNSPVLFMAYDALLQNAAGIGVDRPTLEELSKEFIAIGGVWGERAAQAAKMNLAADLLLTAYETDLAERQIEEVRRDAPELAKSWEELIATVRKRAEEERKRRERQEAIATATQQLRDGETEPAIKSLQRLHAEQPSDPIASYRLAVAERDHGSKDEALRLFGRLAVLPQTEMELGGISQETDFASPREATEKLYEEKSGSRDGLDEFLSRTYRESVTSFLTDEHKNRTPTESKRTVLVELFTGATCPPCVAADVAADAVEQSFPGSDVVVLRYHVHIPGPDPLANADSVARLDYYGSDIEGTPTVLIDGRKAAFDVGGIYSGSPGVYDLLAGAIAKDATKPAEAEIRLSATVEDNVLKINATATGVENASESLRLRVVVAESHIDYAARNGIREHEMVVREMPGGAAGVTAIDGAIKFEQEVSLVDVRNRLVSYLDGYEKEASGQFGQAFEFGVRPLDLKRLTIIAFLQDDATHEVLQSAVVPIDQEIELPPAETKRADKPEPAGNTASPADDGPSLSPK